MVVIGLAEIRDLENVIIVVEGLWFVDVYKGGVKVDQMKKRTME